MKRTMYAIATYEEISGRNTEQLELFCQGITEKEKGVDRKISCVKFFTFHDIALKYLRQLIAPVGSYFIVPVKIEYDCSKRKVLT